jgi:hypothetical protein
MEMDCIPAGMELFPATDEEQWQFIRTIIDDCDYYLLIIGGRYGSTTPEGISYTEKEFDYAVNIGLRVVALVHGSPGDIPFGKSEADPAVRQKLEAFKDKVMDGRLVKFWNSADELPGLVALSLSKTIKSYPAVGWVRGNQVASENILQEINQLRKRNSELESNVRELSERYSSKIDGLADFSSIVTIHIEFDWWEHAGALRRSGTLESTISWRELFALFAPYLLERPVDSIANSTLAKVLIERESQLYKFESQRVDDQEFKTVSIQLKAYGLIDTRYSRSTNGDMALFWSLTEKGERVMLLTRAVRDRRAKEVIDDRDHPPVSG